MKRAIKRNVAARRLAGAVVAAMTAMGGVAMAAQPGYVTSASGDLVKTPYGECWHAGSFDKGQALANCDPALSRTGAAAAGSATTATERTQLAQATNTRSAAAAGVPARRDPSAPGGFEQGYVEDPRGANWRTAYGECWRAGHWTPGMAALPCDAVAQAQAAPPPPPPVVKAPEPQPAPPPVVVIKPEPTPIVVVPAQEPRGPMIQKITLETDVLFAFDKAELREEGKQKLDEIAQGLKGANVNEIVAIGYTDPIGSEQYNEKLSARRAAAVKQYLSQQGVSTEKIVTEGRGEQNLVVSAKECRQGKGRKLIDCLQPNRRVEIEVFGTREVAATEQPAAGGTGAGSGAASSPSSGSGSAR